MAWWSILAAELLAKIGVGIGKLVETELDQLNEERGKRNAKAAKKVKDAARVAGAGLRDELDRVRDDDHDSHPPS